MSEISPVSITGHAKKYKEWLHPVPPIPVDEV
jgi:hypothetical protein